MSDSKEYKKQLANMFAKNTILINENEELRVENQRLKDTIISLGNIIKENKEKWKYLEGRFIKVNFCNDDQRTKCPLYPIDCQGDNCQSFIDMVDLLDKAITNKGIK